MPPLKNARKEKWWPEGISVIWCAALVVGSQTFSVQHAVRSRRNWSWKGFHIKAKPPEVRSIVAVLISKSAILSQGPFLKLLKPYPLTLKKEANLLGRGNRATSTIPEWADFVSSLKPIAEQPHWYSARGNWTCHESRIYMMRLFAEL
jgi:hypothetical protein